MPFSFRSSSAGGSEDERGDAGSRHGFLCSAKVHVLTLSHVHLGSSGGAGVHKEREGTVVLSPCFEFYNV